MRFCILSDIHGNINALKELKRMPIYNNNYKWGILLEKDLKTGIDYPKICREKYDEVRSNKQILEESLDIWNNIINKL